jgi:hypothetical protein
MTLILVCVFLGVFFVSMDFLNSHGSYLFWFGQNCQNGSVYVILCLQSLDIFVGNICQCRDWWSALCFKFQLKKHSCSSMLATFWPISFVN